MNPSDVYADSLKASPQLPTPVDHLVLFYTFQANELEKLSFDDFNVLKDSNVPQNIKVCGLIDTLTMGSYTYSIRNSSVTKKLVQKKAMEDPNTLKEFISNCLAANSAKKVSLILQGHGNSISFEAEPGKTFSVSMVRKVLEELGVTLEYLGLDNCVMSSIETLVELQNCTRYVTANQDYCPNHGVVTPKFISILSDEQDFSEKVVGIAKAEAELNEEDEDAADISAIYMPAVSDLAALVGKLDIRREDFKQLYAIDPNSDHFLYDLYNVVKDAEHVSQEEKEVFENLFKKTVLYYEANHKKRVNGKPKHHGISILVDAQWNEMFSPIGKKYFKQLDFYNMHPLYRERPLDNINDYIQSFRNVLEELKEKIQQRPKHKHSISGNKAATQLYDHLLKALNEFSENRTVTKYNIFKTNCSSSIQGLIATLKRTHDCGTLNPILKKLLGFVGSKSGYPSPFFAESVKTNDPMKKSIPDVIPPSMELVETQSDHYTTR